MRDPSSVALDSTFVILGYQLDLTQSLLKESQILLNLSNFLLWLVIPFFQWYKSGYLEWGSFTLIALSNQVVSVLQVEFGKDLGLMDWVKSRVEKG